MSSAGETVDRLFNSGEYGLLLKGLAAEERELARYTDHHKVTIAHAFAMVGDEDSASRVLSLLPNDRGFDLIRPRFHIVQAITSDGIGNLTKALEHLQSAIRHARSLNDAVQLAWAQLRWLRHLIDRGATTEVFVALADVRAAAMRAGNAHVSAYLHQCVAVLEGQLGRLNEARRHCDIADSLLEGAPNRWLLAGNLVNRACLALVECDFNRAEGYLLAARRQSDDAGLRTSAIDANLAHCQLMSGHFQQAFETIHRVMQSPRSSRLARLGVCEELARLQLAAGRLDDCHEALERLDVEVAKDKSLQQAFHIRWAAITRARLLIKRGQFENAIAFLISTQTNCEAVGDTPLQVTLHLTMASALLVLNKRSGSVSEFMSASVSRPLISGDVQGLYYHTCALLSGHAPDVSKLYARLSRRLWKRQGVVSLPLELEHPGGSASLVGRFEAQTASGQDSAYAAICSLASLFELAHTPELMGEELAHLLKALKCVNETTLRGGRTRESASPVSEAAQVIPLGNLRGAPLELICETPRQPEQAVVFAAVRGVVHAATTLHGWREEERSRAALWPADPPEEQAGALFVADEMKALLATARRVAATTVPVLITGETGTGKEILARTIHGYSPRAKAAFLPFNCTSTPKDMLDSQLFGHRRGSFTGATEHFSGVIRAAAGGTIFLDEIGDMPVEVQPKLLRFLDAGEVHPIGETHPVRADARVIAATNANLDALVTDGRFREDLFYRLNIVRLHVPPLRERRVEIPSLANHYLQRFAREYEKGDLRWAEETMEYLVLYRWPGNVRQLANEVRRMAALCEAGAVLMPEHLSTAIAASRRTVPPSERVLDPTEVVVRLDQPLAAATEHLHRAMLQYAFSKSGGSMEETAARLGLSRKGLYLKRVRFGIEPPEAPAAIGAA